MSETDCMHRDVIGHEHGAWCQECGKQVGGSMLREPITLTKEQVGKLTAQPGEPVAEPTPKSSDKCPCGCNYPDHWKQRVEPVAEPQSSALPGDKCKHGIFTSECDECDGPTFEGNDGMASSPSIDAPQECVRCNTEIKGKPWCLCHRCDKPLCGITCEEWHLDKDCGERSIDVAPLVDKIDAYYQTHVYEKTATRKECAAKIIQEYMTRERSR